MPHTTTRKIPSQEWLIERNYLIPWEPIQIQPAYILRYVRLDNTIAFQGNFYSLPQGTYKKDTTVMIWLKDDELHVHDSQKKFLCKHPLAQSKGNKVINTDHKRDKTQKLKDLVANIAALFTNPKLAAQYFELIRQVKGRYLRDQVQAIREAIKGCDEGLVNMTLEKCVQERYLSAIAFSEILTMYEQQDKSLAAPTIAKIILMDPNNITKAETKPDKSNLGDYEKFFTK